MGNSERKALVLVTALLSLKVMLAQPYWSPSSIGMVMSTALPGPFMQQRNVEARSGRCRGSRSWDPAPATLK